MTAALYEFNTAPMTTLLDIAKVLFGAVMGFVLSRKLESHKDRLQRQQKYNEERREEYKPLIEQLDSIIRAIVVSRPDLAHHDIEGTSSAIGRYDDIIAMRIVINNELGQSGVLQQWKDLLRLVNYDPELQVHTPMEFQYSTSRLYTRKDKLLDTLKEWSVKHMKLKE